MERHVPCHGENHGGYPMRAIRTREYHYIRNFKPDRWPGGDPNGLEKSGAQPFTYEQLARNTNVALADIDSGPTKAYLTLHRDEPAVRPLYDMAAGKRPERELFDLGKDPYQMRNVAADPKYADVVKRMDARLMALLRASGDPRIGDNPTCLIGTRCGCRPGPKKKQGKWQRANGKSVLAQRSVRLLRLWAPQMDVAVHNSMRPKYFCHLPFAICLAFSLNERNDLRPNS